MKFICDHTYGFGKMRNQNIIYVPFGVMLEPNEYKEYLEQGWYPATNDIWFQTRSTRINLEHYKPTKTVLRLAKKVKYFPDVNMTPAKRERLARIYDKYIEHKGYSDDMSIDDIITNSHGHIYYVYNGEIVAFAFHKVIEDAYLGIEFAWDYEEPKLSLGHVNVYYNSLFARFKRCKYIYLSSGYESCSIYKSQYLGFEWWLGYQWSTDVEMYRELCKRDDEIKIEAEGLI
jgi:arginyl-tRNA--protein-N-Asp/Glu arginylyltransferase